MRLIASLAFAGRSNAADRNMSAEQKRASAMSRTRKGAFARLTAAAFTAALAFAAAFSGGAAHAQIADPLGGFEAFWLPNKEPLAKGTRALSTTAPNAIVIDATTSTVLGVKLADRAIEPASMTKMMTALMVFEALERGDLELFDKVKVSARAAKREGSSMNLKAGDEPTVDELLQGLIIASGNDAATALAERLAVSEGHFAKAMSARAKELGMDSSNFRNASGLPAHGHRMSVKDLATLSAHLMTAHPKYFGYFGEVSFVWQGGQQLNRNPAVFLDLSELRAKADGLKTGHTYAAGYCVAASATVDTVEGPRRVVVVLAGMKSEKERSEQTEKMLRWAIAQVSR